MLDSPKNTVIENISTIVVIIGEAINAGSNFSFFAIIGSIAPINFDAITIKIIVTDTRTDINGL